MDGHDLVISSDFQEGSFFVPRHLSLRLPFLDYASPIPYHCGVLSGDAARPLVEGWVGVDKGLGIEGVFFIAGLAMVFSFGGFVKCCVGFVSLFTYFNCSGVRPLRFCRFFFVLNKFLSTQI